MGPLIAMFDSGSLAGRIHDNTSLAVRQVGVAWQKRGDLYILLARKDMFCFCFTSQATGAHASALPGKSHRLL